MHGLDTLTPTRRLRDAWAKLRRRDPNPALDELGRLIPHQHAPEVRLARNPREVEEISRLDQLIYGHDAIDVAGLNAWWECYPLGVYVLWKESKIVGGFGIWPLKEKSYQKIVAGEIDETEISERDLYGKRRRKPVTHWYVADIVLMEEYRKTREHLSIVLLEGALSQWLNNSNLASVVELCAFGFTRVGVSFLQDFYFLPHKGSPIPPVMSPNGKPVYTRTTTGEELRKDLERLRRALRRHTPHRAHPKQTPPTESAEQAPSWDFQLTEDAPPRGLNLALRLCAAFIVTGVGLGVHFHPRIQSWEWLANHSNRVGLIFFEVLFVILISWVIVDTNVQRRKYILGSIIINLIITFIQIVGK